MAEQRPGSYARQIDPEGGIKGPDLSPVFDKAADPPPAKAAEQQTPPIHSAQVANTNLSPREPAPASAYDRAKAIQHVANMKADDRAGKSLGKERERGDD